MLSLRVAFLRIGLWNANVGEVAILMTHDQNTQDFCLKETKKKLNIKHGCVSSSKAILYYSLDLTMILGIGYAAFSINSHLIFGLCCLMNSLFLFRLFVLGHDASHNVLFRTHTVNRIAGEIGTSLVLWPFDAWRLSHSVHHLWTNNRHKENSWIPLLSADSEPMRIRRYWSFIWKAFLFPIASFGFMITTIIGLKNGLYGQSAKKNFYLSAISTMLVYAGYIGAIVLTQHLFGNETDSLFYIMGFLFISQLLFHFWLSVVTFLHHSYGGMDMLKSSRPTDLNHQLKSTIYVRFGWLFDVLTHNIMVHPPHHFSSSIPFYNLPAAQESLERIMPGYVRKESFSMKKFVTSYLNFVSPTSNYKERNDVSR